VRAAGELSDGRISAGQRLDMGEMFADRDFVALSFVLLRRLDREAGTD